MPRLTSVDLELGSTIEVTFTTTRVLAEACDTAVLQLTHGNGSELGIRIERGHVSDVYLWDSKQFIRQHLPATHVTIERERITCSIPLVLLPAGALDPRAESSLTINGTPVQTHYPVSIRTHHGADLRVA